MRRRPIIPSVLLLLAPACAEPGRAIVSRGERDEGGITQEELRDKLDQYQDLFEALVRRACDEIVAGDNSRRTKRLTLLWQMRILPMSRNALDQDNPVGSLLDLATLCARQKQYLETGDGKDLFGPHQPVAVRAADEAAAELEKIAALVFSPQQLAEARARVRQFGEEYPLRGEFSGSAVRVTRERVEDSVLQGILAIPLTPFRWLGGVDHTAQAIKGFTVVAARLTEVVEGLAADARLQMQLLMLEMEDLEAVRSALDSVARLAASSERLASTAESLPESIRKELVVAFDEIEAKQSELRKTIRDTRDLAERVDSAGNSLSGAADAIAAMVASFRRPGPAVPEAGHGSDAGGSQSDARPGPPEVRNLPGAALSEQGPASRPFDINDYARMSESVEAAAKELRALAGEIDTVAQSEALMQRMQDLETRMNRLLAETQGRAVAATDHAAWRLAQLLVLGLVLALAYRWLARRYLAPRDSSDE